MSKTSDQPSFRQHLFLKTGCCTFSAVLHSPSKMSPQSWDKPDQNWPKMEELLKKFKYQRNIVQIRPCLQFPLFLQCLHIYSPERKLEDSCKLCERQSLVGHRLLCSSPHCTLCKPWYNANMIDYRRVVLIGTPCKPWYIDFRLLTPHTSLIWLIIDDLR